MERKLLEKKLRKLTHPTPDRKITAIVRRSSSIDDHKLASVFAPAGAPMNDVSKKKKQHRRRLRSSSHLDQSKESDRRDYKSPPAMEYYPPPPPADVTAPLFQYPCDFSSIRATLNGASGQLTVSGLKNGTYPRSSFTDCNRIQVNRIFFNIDGVNQLVPISNIIANTGGVFSAMLSIPVMIAPGTPFAVDVSDPSIPCSGTIGGTTIII